MQYQDDNSNEIFTWKVKAGNRIYFMNVKKDKNDRLYLVIKESKQGDEEGGVKEVHRIMIFEKDFDRFFYGMEQVSKFVNEQIIASNLNSGNYNQQQNFNQNQNYHQQNSTPEYSQQAESYATQAFNQVENYENYSNPSQDNLGYNNSQDQSYRNSNLDNQNPDNPNLNNSL